VALQAIPERFMPVPGEWSESRELYRGLCFKTKDDLKYAVKRYSITRNVQYAVVLSDASRWAIRCKKWEEGCQWRLRGIKSKKNLLFQITQYEGVHTCVFPRIAQSHAQLDASLIAREILNVVRRDPSTSIATLSEIIKDKFGYEVHYKRVWKAKRKAVAKVFGDWEASYSMLPKWLAVLQQRNPGTEVVLDYVDMDDGTGIFLRCFWSFGPSIEGFKHCRPIIQIDGTHLYGKYKGKLLIATAIDANSHLFPLAFAVVQSESGDNWGWFLRHLRERVTDRDDICLISDRGGGIIAAVSRVENGWKEPTAHHRFCLRHICSNFNHKFHNNTAKALLYRAGAQHQPRKFETVIQELMEAEPGCQSFFNNLPVEKWTQAFDGGYRYGWLTTNMAG
jgi:hypothetical protein